ncbi:MAG: DUF4870 domain-containing protein [Saprospiraceae bacterium]|nr:DUF4870 domain-containing protein [Saprospiraceae bacterium]MCB9317828.1 DUF4870 domain-containing protein [Lewinellaceae bacterium]
MITELTREERDWGIALHLSALAMHIIPFGNILGPLIIWSSKRDRSAYLDQQGREVLNFHISWTVGLILAVIMQVIAIASGIKIVIPLLILTGIGYYFGMLYFIIVAALRASDGLYFDYPVLWETFK